MSKFQNSTGGELRSSRDSYQAPKHRGNFWVWAERLLFGFGIVLVAIYGAARIESILSSRAALEKFAAMDLSAPTASRNGGEDVSSLQEFPEAGSPEVDFSLWNEGRVEAPKERPPVPSGAPLAVLLIPKIHLEVPVLDGTDDLTLNHAVGRIAGTAWPGEPGNIGIAGHRDGFFRGLKQIGVGDVIELKTLEGTRTYVVNQIQIVTPDDVKVLRARSRPSLTLVTCYPFYFFGSAPQRYIVTASLTGEMKGGYEESDTRSAGKIGSPAKEIDKQQAE